jgi:DNA gyrase subunit B
MTRKPIKIKVKQKGTSRQARGTKSVKPGSDIEAAVARASSTPRPASKSRRQAPAATKALASRRGIKEEKAKEKDMSSPSAGRQAALRGGEANDSSDLTAGSKSYTAKDIYVLEGLEPVRKRPGMYIGTTGPDGLHHLIWEVVDNSIDEAMAGFAKTITVELMPDNVVSITDDGRGIPVEIHPQTKKSTLETVMTTLHAGGKFGGEAYKVSGGLHGVGVSVVNALSSWVRAEIHKDGGIYVQEYARGIPKYKVKKTGNAKNTGTTIMFSPDPQIFSSLEFSEKKIIEHLRQQAFLTKGVRMNFIDRRSGVPVYHGFCFEGGILSFVKHLRGDKKPLQDEIFYASRPFEKMAVEVAFQYVDDIEMKELSFANNIYTPDGGTHLTGFKSAMTRTINNYARNEGYLKEKDENLISDDTREGLISIVSIKLPEPQFEGQTKARLGTQEARTAVEAVVNEALKVYLEKRPSDGRQIIEKVLLAAKARKAAKAAKDTVLRKGALDGFTLPGKLADCTSKSAEESELYIVEGDSAGGTAKSGRDRRTQAILPLRGKILNVEKSRLDKMLANQEIRALVVALGTAIAEEFDITKIRYHKIVIMSDADVDGAHICTLLLTLFYRYFKPVIENGYLYIAQPPLYLVQKGKEIRYAYSDIQKDAAIAELQKLAAVKAASRFDKLATGAKLKKGKQDEEVEEVEEEALVADESAQSGMGEPSADMKGIKVQRYKGLGEMNAGQLWDTTMNPENRVLKQVFIDDAEEADRLFDILMGDEVEPRKKFIQAQALEVRNLDI